MILSQLKTIVLIGDSITAGFDINRLSHNSIVTNFGVSGDSTIECYQRILSSWFNMDTKAVFLCIGTNDFARNRTDNEILSNIHLIIEKIQSFTDAIIYVTSIFPTRANPPRPNKRITNFNIQLTEKAKLWNCEYFNLHPFFIDEAGMLKKEFTEDGLHLTDSAYELWSKILDKKIGEILK